MRLEWGCVGVNPTRWVLGELVDGEIQNTVAEMIRNPDGSWKWNTYRGMGVEPNLKSAIEAAEKSYGKEE